MACIKHDLKTPECPVCGATPHYVRIATILPIHFDNPCLLLVHAHHNALAHTHTQTHRAQQSVKPRHPPSLPFPPSPLYRQSPTHTHHLKVSGGGGENNEKVTTSKISPGTVCFSAHETRKRNTRRLLRKVTGRTPGGQLTPWGWGAGFFCVCIYVYVCVCVSSLPVLPRKYTYSCEEGDTYPHTQTHTHSGSVCL